MEPTGPEPVLAPKDKGSATAEAQVQANNKFTAKKIDDTAGKAILVTGGNAGIGYALCKELASSAYGCRVFLGARSAERGHAAVASIKAELSLSDEDDMLQLLLIDVSSDASVEAAVAELRTKLNGGEDGRNGASCLFAVVNNAAIGFNTLQAAAQQIEVEKKQQTHTQTRSIKQATVEDLLLATNFYGPKRVCDALLSGKEGGFLEEGGRIVNVSSGGAVDWIMQGAEVSQEEFASRKRVYGYGQGQGEGQGQCEEKKKSTPNWGQLAAAVEAEMHALAQNSLPKDGNNDTNDRRWPYCLTKAGVTAWTGQILARELDQAGTGIAAVSLNPGFIETQMSRGYGAKKTPDDAVQGPLLRCLFGEVVAGSFYASDGGRAPLTVFRDPGMPEYDGEVNPDPGKYKRA
jgi:NAD(P)-dependent dehydrogenase (short-subunit alcohol dehydrogenase family)